jgi:hypothetical protein
VRLSLPVQMLSRRDFLFPDADERYAPEVLAYIHDIDDAQPLGWRDKGSMVTPGTHNPGAP